MSEHRKTVDLSPEDWDNVNMFLLQEEKSEPVSEFWVAWNDDKGHVCYIECKTRDEMQRIFKNLEYQSRYDPDIQTVTPSHT